MSEEKVLQTIRDFYADEPFVRVVDHLPGTKDSLGTNFCDITARVVRGRVLTISCLDNLIKGASGAAVQNFNLMYGYPETTALVRSGAAVGVGGEALRPTLRDRTLRRSIDGHLRSQGLLAGWRSLPASSATAHKPDLTLVMSETPASAARASIRRTWSTPPRWRWTAAARPATGFAPW